MVRVSAHPFPQRGVRRHRAGSDALILERAAAQWWVVDHFELSELGLDSQAVRRRVDGGLLHPLFPGTYAVGRPDPPWRGRYRAAARSCGLGGVVALAAAGTMLGYLRGSPGRIDVLTTSRGLRDRDGIRVRRVAELRPEEVCVVDAVPVTTLARTALDLSRVGDVVRLERLLRSAEQQHADSTELRALARARRPGAPALRRMLEELDPEVVTASGFEDEFRAALLGSGLPPARFNHGVLAAGHHYRLDVYWPAARVAVELDPFETHGDRGAFEHDRERDGDLLLLDVVTVRVTPRRLRHDRARLFAMLAELIARRSLPGAVLRT